ncbi:MAG: hypothetical protein WBG57_07780 [Ornithinimicrobium sp.]
MNISNVEVTAGLGGFLVLFALGLVVWFLGRDLSRRLRRMRHAEGQRVQAERDRAAGDPAPKQATDAEAASDTEGPAPEAGPKSPQG